MTELRLCKDCRFYKKDWFEHLTGGEDQFDMCLNPVVSKNLVTGKAKDRFCDILRMEWGKCGPEGKYWEAKKK